MPRRKSAGSHADQHGASERFDSPREYVHWEPSGKRRTPSVLNQTSQMLSSAGHALSGDGDEAVVILGALAGVAIGTALGIAEKRRQAAAQKDEAPHDDPPQSSPTKHAGALHNDPSQPSSTQQGGAPPDHPSQSAQAQRSEPPHNDSTQPSTEPRQEPASQQIEQPMEQSM